MIKKWIAQLLKKIRQQKAIAICRDCFKSTPSFSLAQKAREEQRQFGYESIYGEIELKSFITLMEKCQIDKNSVFYDLGSGVGKIVICAALLYDFKRVSGIEQLRLLHESANEALKKLPFKKENIFFYQDDLLMFNWVDADIVFINATAFIEDFWQQVLSRLLELKKGAQIILVSKLLPESHFTLYHQEILPMSFGMARVSIYRANKPRAFN